jgi:hypothetical protein
MRSAYDTEYKMNIDLLAGVRRNNVVATLCREWIFSIQDLQRQGP